MDQREEYNLAQNIHNIHCKAIYYQALPQLQQLSVTKKHIKSLKSHLIVTYKSWKGVCWKKGRETEKGMERNTS